MKANWLVLIWTKNQTKYFVPFFGSNESMTICFRNLLTFRESNLMQGMHMNYFFTIPRWLFEHSDLECLRTFGNWFWDLIVGNRSIMLNFYQQWPFFASKNYPRPQRPKRPMKANKGQQSPKLQISFVIITIQCKIINKCQYGTKKCVFKKSEIFIFTT